MLHRPVWFSAFAIFACASTAKEPPPRAGDDVPASAYAQPERRPEGQTAPSSGAATGDSADAPEISRSAGSEGGIVVFWPRTVLPRGARPDDDTRALARRLQARLADVVRRAAPNHPVDVRPEPERVCPRSGCKAASVGVLLARAGNGCAAVALVSGSGTAPAELVPWMGQIALDRTSVPFREPPEAGVRVQDYLKCSSLVDDTSGDATVQSAIKKVVR